MKSSGLWFFSRRARARKSAIRSSVPNSSARPLARRRHRVAQLAQPLLAVAKAIDPHQLSLAGAPDQRHRRVAHLVAAVDVDANLVATLALNLPV